MALYPPIVASSMPAFDIGDGQVKVYFTLSQFEDKTDIKYVHCTVRRQSSNVNVVSSEKGDILSFSFQSVKQQQSQYDKISNRYYVVIKNQNIKEGFEHDVLYKVQLRFSSSETGTLTTSDVNKFSEWSTVCIIKPIIAPKFYIDQFYIQDGDDSNSQSQNNFSSYLSDFTGVYSSTIVNQDGTTVSSSEVLKNWRIRLLTNEYSSKDYLNIDNYTLADSQLQSVTSNNYINVYDNALVLNCSLPYQMTRDEEYKLLFEIKTTNGYQKSILYTFMYRPAAIGQLEIRNGQVKTISNEEQGYIKIVASAEEVSPYRGNLVLRRTDSSTNFLKWEDLKNYFFDGSGQINLSYYDFTVQSGLMYRYLIQKRDSRGRRGKPLYDQVSQKVDQQGNPLNAGTLVEWNHAFLLQTTGNGEVKGTRQLKLKFDFQISNYKTNIAESKTDTIGSKYPFIRRNGNMGYKSFSCSGTISEFMDDADLFTSKEQLFNGLYDNYVEYQGQIQNYVNKYDYTYERKFREKVEEFLYNNKPKLYKSTQEGNIFIKLMEVSLSPKNELGRLVYTFSASAYEIDECTIQNLNKYNLISTGTYLTIYSIPVSGVLGQLTGSQLDLNVIDNSFPGGEDIFDILRKKYYWQEGRNGQILTDYTIRWLRLTVDSNPYLIEKEQQRYSGTEFSMGEDGSDLKSIIISPLNNVYQIEYPIGPSFKIVPTKEVSMTVDYIIDLQYEQDTTKVAKAIQMSYVNGQLAGTFGSNKNLLPQIGYKYFITQKGENNRIANQKYLKSLNSVWIDTQPGVEVKIQTTSMEEETSLIINHTGELHIDPHDPEEWITSIKILGLDGDPVDALIFYNITVERKYYE